MAHPAEVMLEVDCYPIAELQHAELSIEQNGIELMHRGRSVESWQREIDAGTYDFLASFPAQQHPQKNLPGEIVYPPLSHLTFLI